MKLKATSPPSLAVFHTTCAWLLVLPTIAAHDPGGAKRLRELRQHGAGRRHPRRRRPTAPEFQGAPLASHKWAAHPRGAPQALVVDAARISGRVLWFDARKNYGAIQPDRPLPGCDGGDGGAPYVFVHGMITVPRCRR